jgi:hypothetical protein
MASRTATVAEAVKAALNTASAAGAFGATFTAKRVYAPVEPLDTDRGLVVTVWCPGDEVRQEARGFRSYDVPVLVALHKAMTPAAGDGSAEASNDELDALMEVAERVADLFGRDGVAKCGGADWTGTELSLGNPDAMRERRQFFAVATLRFTLTVRT